MVVNELHLLFHLIFWIKIACPESVRVWRVALRGRISGNERIYNWRIEGSTDNNLWTTLYTAADPPYLGICKFSI